MERSNERLRIVQLAPPWFAIPPTAYGGIELVINDLSNGLAALGHDVSLIAPGIRIRRRGSSPMCRSTSGSTIRSRTRRG